MYSVNRNRSVWSFDEKLLVQPMRGSTFWKLIASCQKRMYIVRLNQPRTIPCPHSHEGVGGYRGVAPKSMQSADLSRRRRRTAPPTNPFWGSTWETSSRDALVYRARSRRVVFCGSEESSTIFPRMDSFRAGCVRKHVLACLPTDG